MTETPAPTALETALKSRIRTHGPITVAEYMQTCLYHPEIGYYTRGLNFLTQPPQDFLTAPEHTPLFGATIANWVAQTWTNLGSPSPFTLIECGPGRGTLMHDILTHLQQAYPLCSSALCPVLLETSPILTALQQQTLAPFPQCQWQTELQATSHNSQVTSHESQVTILLANEFLDAFPINQYLHSGGKLYEILIDLHPQTEDFHFITSETEAPVALPKNWEPAEGAILEIALDEAPFLQTLAETVSAALLIDYGAAQRATQGGDTLQAVYRHQPVPLFHRPGECDLTAHINFSSLIARLGPSNCTLKDLSPFLLENGILDLALATMPPLQATGYKLQANPQHPTPETALHRLLHPAQMGTLFKVLCYTPSTR